MLRRKNKGYSWIQLTRIDSGSGVMQLDNSFFYNLDLEFQGIWWTKILINNPIKVDYY